MDNFVKGNPLKSAWFYGFFIISTFITLLNCYMLTKCKIPIPLSLLILLPISTSYTFSIWNSINTLEYRDTNKVKIKLPLGDNIFTFARTTEALFVSYIIVYLFSTLSVFSLSYLKNNHLALSLTYIVPFAMIYQGIFISVIELNNLWFYLILFAPFSVFYMPYLLYQNLDNGGMISSKYDFNGKRLKKSTK